MAVATQESSPLEAYGRAAEKLRLDKATATSYEKSTVRAVNCLESGPHFSYVLCKSRYGNEVDGCLEGHGRLVFKDGHVYEGDLRAGVMHGDGHYTWSSGTTYQGQFENCKIQGKGEYTWRDGSTYAGEVENGIRNGSGTCHVGSTPAHYTGFWSKGKRNGKGTMVYDAEGLCRYEGEWQDGLRQGQGSMRYSSGNTYVGGWHGNKRHGQGTMTWVDTGEVYSGEWASGLQHGFGEHTWSLSRPDISQYPLLNRYCGAWQEGKREGQGTFFYANGAYYSGMWSANQKHGRGTLVLQNGSTLHCLFHHDVLVSSSHDPEGVSADHRTLPLRTKTPLTTLIGDVDTLHRDDSRTEKFNSSISTLIPDGFNLEWELKQVYCVILRHVSLLKRIYHLYTKLGSVNSTFGALSIMQLCRLIKDCGLHRHGYNVLELIGTVELELGSALDHTSSLLMREFLQLLVHVACKIYGGDTYQSGAVASCLEALIQEHLSQDITVKGSMLSHPHTVAIFAAHEKKVLSLFESLSDVAPGSSGGGGVRLRRILLQLKDCSIIPTHLPTKEAIQILVEDNPLALDGADYNLEARVCFLEFSEIVCDLSCAFYPSYKQQQAGAGREAGGQIGGSLGRAPSAEQKREEAEEVEEQASSHMSTVSQQEGRWSLDHQGGSEEVGVSTSQQPSLSSSARSSRGPSGISKSFSTAQGQLPSIPETLQAHSASQPDVTESTFELALDSSHQEGKSLPHDEPPVVATPTDSQKEPQSEPTGAAESDWCRDLDPALTALLHLLSCPSTQHPFQQRMAQAQ